MVLDMFHFVWKHRHKTHHFDKAEVRDRKYHNRCRTKNRPGKMLNLFFMRKALILPLINEEKKEVKEKKVKEEKATVTHL